MSLLEPVIILVMGLVVGFIVVAILLPILQMSTGVR
jgi:general secretion pathway protein F